MADYSVIKKIKDFSSLIEYLHDELDWDFQTEDIEDLTFDYEPEELGLDEATATKITSIKQLRPLVANQTWGIFYIDFEPKKLPVVALRRILGKLVVKRRTTSKDSSRAAWQMHDLLFISSCGEKDTRTMTFAHFSDNTDYGDLPTLKTLSWNNLDTKLHLEHAHETLKDKLHFPDNPNDAESWRKLWSSAFTLKHGEVVRTSKQLAIRLAELATNIRESANTVLQHENEKGSLRRLYNAFQEALIHDLSEDDFADMYAQTVSYGLLTAKISRPAGLVADNLADMIPVTNPFLKELLQTFLVVGGRGNLIDFDELGINDVVEMLRKADMEAVLRDFGDRNPTEDPAIHFYELFLKEYDPEKRMKRGVFYTPRPVVSFIVRSVHEILQKEFGLEDGLASTTTWREFIEQQKIRNPQSEIRIPEGVSPNAPFVQILDPATGTGTFLVEVIEQIHKTMIEKWESEGKNEQTRRELWNEYVPKHLLPRLFGFELMMAPYSIAHMKIGLKLKETGYNFLSSERAQIYLTNTLEEPKDFSDYFAVMSPALAHEAEAANRVKRHAPITVVIGNPPYSGHSSNNGDWIYNLLRGRDILDDAATENYFEVDGQSLNERNPKWLNDDYVKFIRYSQRVNEKTGIGLLAFITNNGYLDNPTFRGMRQSLTATYNKIYLLDLHGSAKKKEKSPDGSKDENVFDIEQGVGIGAFVSTPDKNETQISHAHLFGVRENSNDNGKYQWLLKNNVVSTEWTDIDSEKPFYLLIPQDAILSEEFQNYWNVTESFPVNVLGFQTHRDFFAIDFEKGVMQKRIKDLCETKLSDDEIYEKYELENSHSIRSEIRSIKNWQSDIISCSYRPFDDRYTFYSVSINDRPRRELLDHVAKKENLCLGLGRQGIAVNEDVWALTWISCKPVDANIFRRGGINIFPLYLYPTERDMLFYSDASAPPRNRYANFSDEFIKEFSAKLNLRFEANAGNADGSSALSAKREESRLKSNNADEPSAFQFFTPEDVFHYAYAVFHSPTYRTRYAEFLKIDFPRLPLTSDVALFRSLCALGADLVALHLLEDDYAAASWNQMQKPARSKGAEDVTENRALTNVRASALNPLAKPIADFVGTDKEVAKGFPKYEDEKVYINKTSFFGGIPEAVWNFHIGGYQVPHKWLKDRRERTLTDEDIKHYTRVVTSLNETIRLMTEIDALIEEHGGFPLVGSQDTTTPKKEPKETPALPFD